MAEKLLKAILQNLVEPIIKYKMYSKLIKTSDKQMDKTLESDSLWTSKHEGEIAQ